jgi:hypothetical protein
MRHDVCWVAVLGSLAGACSSQKPPAPGNWREVAPMKTPRRSHGAAMLPDGKVLVAGGSPTFSGYSNHIVNDWTSSAEIYDPVADAWQPTAPMHAARGDFNVISLPDGRVLVIGSSATDVSYDAGGIPWVSGAHGLTEIFDPATATWSDAGETGEVRIYAASVMLSGGDVLLSGGLASGGNAFSSTAERWSPGTGSWRPAASMSIPRYHARAFLLPTGKVLVVGGSNANAASSSEIYDPSTDTWSAGPSPIGPHSEDAPVTMSDGTIVIVASTAERFDVASSRFVAMSTPPFGLHSACATGRDAILGVRFGSGTALYRSGQWTAIAAPPGVTFGALMQPLRDGRVLMAGGIGPEVGRYSDGTPRSTGLSKAAIFTLP